MRACTAATVEALGSAHGQRYGREPNRRCGIASIHSGRRAHATHLAVQRPGSILFKESVLLSLISRRTALGVCERVARVGGFSKRELALHEGLAHFVEHANQSCASVVPPRGSRGPSAR